MTDPATPAAPAPADDEEPRPKIARKAAPAARLRKRGVKRQPGHDKGAKNPGQTVPPEVKAQVVALRLGGAHYDAIARATGLSKATVWRIIDAWAHEQRVENAESNAKQLEIQVSRLDDLLSRMRVQLSVAKTVADTTRAVSTILQIEKRRADLLGLDAPAKQEIVIIAEEARREAELMVVSLMDALNLTADQRVRAADFFARRAETMRRRGISALDGVQPIGSGLVGIGGAEGDVA